jgi:drug/metabolite transporter (DMT)-like permease
MSSSNTREHQLHRPMTFMEWTLLLLIAGFWGGSYFFTGVAIKELPVFAIVMARYAVSAPIMIMLIFWLGQRFPWHADIWKAGLFLAAFNQLIPFCLITWGQSHIPGAVASIVNAAGPIVTLVMAHFLTRDDRMNARRGAGVVIGFAGMAIMIGAGALQALNVSIAAQLACVLATFSYSFGAITARKFTKARLTSAELVAAQSFVAGLLLLPVLLIHDRPWELPMPSLSAWLSLLGLGLLSSTIGHLIFFRLLATAGATNMSLVSYFMPVSAILLGVVFLGEVLQPRHIAGMCIIAAGLAIMDGRPLRASRKIGAR